MQRLSWWVERYGHLTISRRIWFPRALQQIGAQPSRYYGHSIFKAKHRSIAPATVNRYAAALAAALTWAVKKRIALAAMHGPAS